jgi:hypothetical protein
MVRLAFETSVTCTPLAPPVRFQMTQLSIVPNSRSPASALCRAPGMLSSSQRILGPEKYVASGSPTRERKRSWPPSRASSAMNASVRVSCQTMALWIGRQRPADHLSASGPDLERVVLDPAGLRVYLLVLPLIYRDDGARMVEHHEARARRSLVECSHVLLHPRNLCSSGCFGSGIRRLATLRAPVAGGAVFATRGMRRRQARVLRPLAAPVRPSVEGGLISAPIDGAIPARDPASCRYCYRRSEIRCLTIAALTRRG